MDARNVPNSRNPLALRLDRLGLSLRPTGRRRLAILSTEFLECSWSGVTADDNATAKSLNWAGYRLEGDYYRRVTPLRNRAHIWLGEPGGGFPCRMPCTI
jgi:hypothetical protein